MKPHRLKWALLAHAMLAAGMALAQTNSDTLPTLTMGKDKALEYMKANRISPYANNLHSMAMDAKANAVIALLASGVSPNLKDAAMPQSPLFMASTMGCISNAAMPQSPLFMASTMGCISKTGGLNEQLRTMDALIAAGADVNFELPEGLGILMMSAQQCPAVIVKRLLNAGAKIDQRSPQGITPLTMALMVQNVEAATALVDAGAKLSASGAKLFDAEDTNPEIKALVKRALVAQ
jgi:ankyrin repeat protein